jgi:lipid-binding SYLF domain-containing protein
MRKHHVFASMAPFVAVILCAGLAHAHPDTAKLMQDARDTVATFKRTDPGLSGFFERSVGFVVFPTVGKGAVGVGGAHGHGILFDRIGTPLGRATLTQLTVGLQLGGQAYSEIIFFETPGALAKFKDDGFAFAAQASAVALRSGAAANAKFDKGVAVFSATKAGLMYEASVGGQKFSFEAFPARPK